MKTSLLLLISLCIVNNGNAQPSNWGLSDPELAACISKLAIKNNWQSISDVTAIKCHSAGIASVQGLEHFTQLRGLSLYRNKLTEIDSSIFSQLKHLKNLNLANNHLQQITITHPNIEQLYLFGNRLNDVAIIGFSNTADGAKYVQKMMANGLKGESDERLTNNMVPEDDIHVYIPGKEIIESFYNQQEDKLRIGNT